MDSISLHRVWAAIRWDGWLPLIGAASRVMSLILTRDGAELAALSSSRLRSHLVAPAWPVAR